MTAWCREHSLSLALAGLYLTFQTLAAIASRDPFSPDYWQAMFQGHADDTLGALLIVVFTKFLVERGKRPSHESR